MSTNLRIPADHPARTSNFRRAALFAYAAGAAGILANLFLIGFFALQASHPEDGTSLGTANDLVGSLATAFMIPVALALSAWLLGRRSVRLAQVVGVSAMAVLAVSGPLLVFEVQRFNVQTPIAMAAWIVLSLWLLLVNRWLRLSAALRPRLARLGEFLGRGIRGRWAGSLTALDVVAATGGVRRRRPYRAALLARHLGLVPALGPAFCGVTMSESAYRGSSFQQARVFSEGRVYGTLGIPLITRLGHGPRNAWQTIMK